jgi:hypothetical protein
LADGSTYSFTYETTPGISSSVTGRLASVTLPTTGKITYTYSGGCAGSGINSDGTPPHLTRKTGDGTRDYTRATISSVDTTTLQDEKGNQTLYQFTIANSLFYETHRQVYPGAVGGTPLLDQQTCYNGAAASCDGAAVVPPISSTATLRSFNGGASDTIQNTYDASGNQTLSTASVGGSPLTTQQWVYNTLEELTSVLTKDASGKVVSNTTYGY